jgi:hypothetical protein
VPNRATPHKGSTLVLFSVSDTREPLATLATLLDELGHNENHLTVVDTSALARVKHDLPPAWIARLLGVRVTHHRVHEIAEKRNAHLITLDLGWLPNVHPETPEEIRDELAEAVVSGYLSYLRDDIVPSSRRHQRRLEESTNQTVKSYWWLRSFLDEHPEFDTVVVPNGRVADQRAFIHAARSAERKILFYEIGRATSKAIYVGSHQIHDRVGTQQQALLDTAGLSPKKARAKADEWMNRRRRPKSDINQFSRAWQKKAAPVQTPATGPIATFFSSSADEFTALGPEWRLQEWEDQYDGFDAIANLLESTGVRCRLRVHPNLANKSHRHFWSEIKKIRAFANAHPQLEIIWPNQPFDSYELVEQSDYIIVARSTIGLEASVLGKCVWTITPTRYDLIADVRKIWGPDEATLENLTLWKADSTGAARFITHLLETDIPFSSDVAHTNPWNSSSPPWRVRLANFFIPQPLSHKLHIVTLEVFAQIQKRLPESVLTGK